MTRAKSHVSHSQAELEDAPVDNSVTSDFDLEDLDSDNLEPFRNKSKITVKPAFEARYRQLLGESYERFMEYSLSFNRRAIRVNTLKISVPELVARLEKEWILTPVPWASECFWITHRGIGDDHRRDVGNLLEHALGYIYVQEPASAIPPLVLDPKPGEAVLDMCAAPGSKTSQIAAMMQNDGFLHANEYSGSRIASLGINLQRLGVSCAVITCSDGNRLDKNVLYDRILVDGPCSGTGTIRKSPKTLVIWNPNMIKRLGRTQLALLNNAYKHLKVGGVMVYSTCTLEPDENEGVVHKFLESNPDMDVLPISLNIVRSQPIREWDGVVFDSRVSLALRIYPQDNDSEGFFVCKFVKKG
jgi:tRNA (cytosine49-C5)-methyltransferase